VPRWRICSSRPPMWTSAGTADSLNRVGVERRSRQNGRSSPAHGPTPDPKPNEFRAAAWQNALPAGGQQTFSRDLCSFGRCRRACRSPAPVPDLPPSRSLAAPLLAPPRQSAPVPLREAVYASFSRLTARHCPKGNGYSERRRSSQEQPSVSSFLRRLASSLRSKSAVATHFLQGRCVRNGYRKLAYTFLSPKKQPTVGRTYYCWPVYPTRPDLIISESRHSWANNSFESPSGSGGQRSSPNASGSIVG